MTLDDFVEKHKPLILSTLYMVSGLLLAGYTILYSRLDVYSLDLTQATAPLSARNRTVEAERKTASEEKKTEKSVGVRYLPTFLIRINQIANANDVIIRKLSPDRENPFKFILEIITDYYTFVRFTAGLESLDIVLDNIQIHPYDAGKTPPLHAVSFSLIPRNDAQPLSGDRLKHLQESVARFDKRNPFQRFAYDPTRKVQPVIDWTWIHKLGGIGLTVDGRPYATINRESHLVGDRLDGATITGITKDRVSLERLSETGKTRFVIGFRRHEKPKQ